MTYPGGKGAAGVAQTIINQQPPHDAYIEAFLGSGAVMRAKRPARRNIGIDIDASTIGDYSDDRSIIAISDAAGSRNQLLCGDALPILESLRRTLTGRTLLYCDPPYLMAVRRSARRLYRHELADEQQHRELLDLLLTLPCMVQISGYWSSLYAEMLQDWRLVRFQAMTRGGIAEECLWMNYPEPAALHDYRYLGADFRERERIKRKVTRWTARLNSLPQLERLALYSSIAAAIDANGECNSRDPLVVSSDDGRRLPTQVAMTPAASFAPAMLEAVRL